MKSSSYGKLKVVRVMTNIYQENGPARCPNLCFLAISSTFLPLSWTIHLVNIGPNPCLGLLEDEIFKNTLEYFFNTVVKRLKIFIFIIFLFSFLWIFFFLFSSIMGFHNKNHILENSFKKLIYAERQERQPRQQSDRHEIKSGWVWVVRVFSWGVTIHLLMG